MNLLFITDRGWGKPDRKGSYLLAGLICLAFLAEQNPPGYSHKPMDRFVNEGIKKSFPSF
jgi:hypothetical protein